ncbi:TRAP transporter large permease [Denitrobaculum tricleocarpae]|uniref:TRAP transporter large permease protein n=1 Tax=Denitrobaculum tricleocarpae TaxID=2591009 RepID=A0A545TGD2_9PROT|nr:TRAP transporter large permease [Denitrobaculum tricleocarpae]TQV76289.1 TRAP transporter large permease [Denitrobaculum tricleocarpae]
MILFTSTGLLVLLSFSIPVGIVLFLLAFGIDHFFSPFPLMRGLGQVIWSSSNSATLIAIPFFVLLGEVLVRSGVARRTYAALDAWVSWLPGGLIHANIATATLFSATSGSSVATAATVASVAMPQAEKLGYDAKLFSGAIAAGGTLGIMIPPSINLIVYGFLTETSIPKLFLAGLVPGLLLALLFMAMTALVCGIKPSLGGPGTKVSWERRIASLKDLLPLLGLFGAIVGSIYAGWATPTEAAAVGVGISFVIAGTQKALSREMLLESLKGTVRTTALIMLVVIGAYVLNFVLTAAGVSRALQDLLQNLGLGAVGTLLVIVLIYIVLGFFIETLSLMVATIPIVVPVIVQLGYDPLWFGILMILLVEMALITPPVGLNLYVVQAARKAGSFTDVMIGAAPYAVAMLVMAGLLILFPAIALFLPSNL